MPEILLIRGDGSLQARIASSHPPLGILESGAEEIECEVFAVEDEGAALIYSDGLTEANNSSGEMYGVARLDWLLSGGAGSSRLLDAVKEDVLRFVGETNKRDDITVAELSFGDAARAGAVQHTDKSTNGSE